MGIRVLFSFFHSLFYPIRSHIFLLQCFIYVFSSHFPSPPSTMLSKVYFAYNILKIPSHSFVPSCIQTASKCMISRHFLDYTGDLPACYHTLRLAYPLNNRASTAFESSVLYNPSGFNPSTFSPHSI